MPAALSTWVLVHLLLKWEVRKEMTELEYSAQLSSARHSSRWSCRSARWEDWRLLVTSWRMRTNLVKIVLVFVFEAGERDLVQVYELLEVWPSVGTVREVGVLKMKIKIGITM